MNNNGTRINIRAKAVVVNNKKVKKKRLGFFLIVLVILSCSSSKVITKKDYVITKHKSENSRYLPYLIVSCFDYYPEGKRNPIPASIKINDLLFLGEIVGDSIHNVIFRPIPNNTFDIEVNWLGKIPVQINNLRINENDSIIVEINMKDSNEPIICY